MAKIKRIDDLFSDISEALDNPLPIKWIDKNDKLIGLFTVNNNVYQINCINKGSNIWKYDFYKVENPDKFIFLPELTGLEKDKWRVLPTIKDGMYYLISNKLVDAIVFGATDKSKGRKKIYDSFCKDFSEKNNFEFYTKIQDDKQLFILFRKNINMKNLGDIVTSIIEEEKY
jgi:hypothetical protein